MKVNSLLINQKQKMVNKKLSCGLEQRKNSLDGWDTHSSSDKHSFIDGQFDQANNETNSE